MNSMYSCNQNNPSKILCCDILFCFVFIILDVYLLAIMLRT